MRLPLFALLGTLLLSLQAHAGVGLRSIEIHEPTTGTTMPAMVFYPSTDATPATQVGPYKVDAAFAAAPSPGRHPLVLLSHGHAGSSLGHHPLAVSLANAGYIVAAVEHAGDSYRDQSGFGTERVLYGRAWQVSSLLDALLADTRFGALIDPERIGVAGFSAGGYTSLLLLGAEPDPARRLVYCKQHPKDEELCLQKPANAAPLTERRPTADARVRAAFVMAPLAVFFSPETLNQVEHPVYVHAALADRTLLPDWNALAVRDGVARLSGWRGIEGADHYVYLAPCPPAMAQVASAICTDPPGIDRAAIQAQAATDAIAFFGDTLAER